MTRLIVPVEEGEPEGGPVGRRHRRDDQRDREESPEHPTQSNACVKETTKARRSRRPARRTQPAPAQAQVPSPFVPASCPSCLRGFLCGLPQLREALAGGGEAWIDLERAAERGRGLVALVLPGQGQAEVVGVLRVGRRRAWTPRETPAPPPARSPSPASTMPSEFQYDAIGGSSSTASRSRRAASAGRPSVAEQLAELDADQRIARRQRAPRARRRARAAAASPSRRAASPSHLDSRGSSGDDLQPAPHGVERQVRLAVGQVRVGQPDVGGRVRRKLLERALVVRGRLAPALQSRPARAPRSSAPRSCRCRGRTAAGTRRSSRRSGPRAG